MTSVRLVSLATYVLLIIVWVIYFFVINHPLILPSPWMVLEKTFDILTNVQHLVIIISSISRLLVIIVCTMALALSFAWIASRSKHFAACIKPIIAILRSVPTIAILVIIMILYGMHLTPWIITTLIIFPMAYQSFYFGFTHMDKDLIDMYHLNEQSLYMGLKLVYFPMIKPWLTLTLIQSFGMGFKVLLMAEYLSQTPHSIGNELFKAKSFLNYDVVFAWTLIALLIVSWVEYVLLKYEKRKLNDI